MHAVDLGERFQLGSMVFAINVDTHVHKQYVNYGHRLREHTVSASAPSLYPLRVSMKNKASSTVCRHRENGGRQEKRLGA